VNEFWKFNKTTPKVITLKIQELQTKFKKRAGSVASIFQAAAASGSESLTSASLTSVTVPPEKNNLQRQGNKFCGFYL
jgi:hypothetical protein